MAARDQIVYKHSVLLWLWLVLLLLIIDGYNAKKTSKSNKLKVYKVDVPATCDIMIQAGDHISYHYEGTLADGTIVIPNTEYVGRPYEMTIGSPKEGFYAAIEKGVKGACNGELRRIVVPPNLYREGASNIPNKTVNLDVHILRVNDVSHELGQTAVNNSVVAECGACRYFAKAFSQSWKDTALKNAAQIDGGDGNSLPVLTYNENLESMVQKFCKSEKYHHSRASKYGANYCKKMMTQHKRKVVEYAMSALYDSPVAFMNSICGQMTNSCQMIPETKVSDCQLCQSLVRDVQHALVMQGSNLINQPLEKRIRHILINTLCHETVYFYKDHIQAADVCEELVDDYATKLVTELTSANLDDRDAPARAFCSKTLCKDVEDDTSPFDKSEL